MSLTASLIDLKAELSKKREEAKDKGSQRVNPKGGYKWKMLADKLDYRGKVKQLRAKCEKTQDEEEKKAIEEEIEKALRLSRQALERKAKIYEKKMSKAMEGIFEDSDEQPENEDEICLVNFDEKALMQIKTRNEERKQAQERLKGYKRSNDDDDDDSDAEEDWVEFIDSLGRSRRCLRKDLKYFVEADQNLKRNPESRGEDGSAKRPRDEQDFGDNHDEEEESIPQGPIHYENIRFNEVRDHGVGFYQFSGESEERKKQMESLHKLREQTLKQREIKSRIKEKRNNILEQRLARIAARRGIPIKPKDQVETNESTIVTGEESDLMTVIDDGNEAIAPASSSTLNNSDRDD